MADTALGHDGNGNGILYFFDHAGIGHACDAALGSDVGGNAFEGHDGGGASRFGNFRLGRIGDIHDHPALEHLCQSDFRPPCVALPGGPEESFHIFAPSIEEMTPDVGLPYPKSKF